MKKDYAHQALMGVSLILFVYFLNALVTYGFRLLMAKNLSIADYGLFYSLLSFLSLIYIVRDMGFNQALVKFLPKFLVHKKEGKVKSAILFIFGIELVLSAIVTAAIIISAPWLAANYFHSSDAVFAIQLFSLVFFVFAFDYILATLLQSFQRITSLALFMLLRTAGLFVSTAILFALGLNIDAPMFGYLIVSAVSALILIPYIAHKVFALHKIHATWSGRENWKLVRYGIIVFISGIGGTLLQNIDTMLLTYMRGLVETGIYNVASPTANIILYFSGAVTTVAFPLFSELHASRSIEQIRAAFKIIYRFAFLGTIPVVMLFIGFPEIIIRLLFGEKFIAAAVPLQILVIGTFLYVITQINFTFFNASSRQKYPLVLLFLAAAVNFIGDVLLIPKYGMIGAAGVTLFCFTLMFVISIVLVKRAIELPLPILFWVKTTAIGLVFLACISYLKSILTMQPYLEAVIVGSIGLLVYAALVFAAGLTSVDEMKWFAQKILKRA